MKSVPDERLSETDLSMKMGCCLTDNQFLRQHVRDGNTSTHYGCVSVIAVACAVDCYMIIFENVRIVGVLFQRYVDDVIIPSTAADAQGNLVFAIHHLQNIARKTDLSAFVAIRIAEHFFVFYGRVGSLVINGIVVDGDANLYIRLRISRISESNDAVPGNVGRNMKTDCIGSFEIGANREKVAGAPKQLPPVYLCHNREG